MSDTGGRILVVDDDATNRLVLERALQSQGHEVVTAEDGVVALRTLRGEPDIDLVLLDVMMPEMDGVDVLRFIKGEPTLAALPVVMISALDDSERIASCLELGADDYLPKPFDPRVLRARVGASLTRKRWRDIEQSYVARIEEEEQKADRLLRAVLPRHIAERLKAGETSIADRVEDATVLFADVAGFTAWAATEEAPAVVQMLDGIFRTFDTLVASHGLEKIKTIGDEYMAVGGLFDNGPDAATDHAADAVHCGLDMLEAIAVAYPFEIRVGVHTGPLVAGVIGADKPIYDVWGDTVNIASRMESQGESGRIQMSDETHRRVAERFDCESRGVIDLRHRGAIHTWWLDREAEGANP